jgi:hemerythrin-like domain-containing protein
MLVDTLKQQHKELILYIRQMDVLLARGDETGARAVISTLSAALRTHLALEDQHIYPALTRAAEVRQSEWMQELAKLFAANMQRITTMLQDFLSRQHEASFHLEQFRADWSCLSAVLVRRIEAEERTLYPLYERRFLGVPASLMKERSLLPGE